MSRALQMKLTRIAMFAAAMIVCAATVFAQGNPYRLVDGWAQLPANIKFGAVISVDVDPKGNIWVFHRADPMILEFAPSGKLLKSLGNMTFLQAHGMTIDREGNIWVTDGQNKDGKGQQVFKLNQDGKVLMTLGKAGVAAEGPDTFNGPTDVVIAPNGDIFVSDGHLANANGRIVKFSKDGKFIKAWGKKGKGPGEMDTPHAITMDSKGRLFVADRGNSRVQIFDQDGKFIDQWKQFGRPSGIYIDKNDTIYVVDSQSNAMLNPGFKRGLRVGSAKDGKVTAFVPFVEPDPDKNANAGMEGVTADAMGNIFVGETSTMMLKKFVRASSSN
jgi:sugar lactone lactonase YvrE